MDPFGATRPQTAGKCAEVLGAENAHAFLPCVPGRAEVSCGFMRVADTEQR